jgi:hypothetical protein
MSRNKRKSREGPSVAFEIHQQHSKRRNAACTFSSKDSYSMCLGQIARGAAGAQACVYMQHLGHRLDNTRLHASTLNHVSALRDAVDM